MKKTVIIGLILLLFSSLYSETIVLSNHKIIHGELVGKKGDILYVVYPLGNIKTDRTSIRQIRDISGEITDAVFAKPDFFTSSYSREDFKKWNKQTKYDVKLFGKDKYVSKRINLNVESYYVKVGGNDPIYIGDKSFTTYLKRDRSYNFTFLKNGYEKLSKTLETSDSSQEWYDLKKGNYSKDFAKEGYIIVDSEPQSAIYIDKIKIGATPKQIKITAGSHKLSLLKEWYKILERTIKVEENKILDLGKLTLSNNFGHFEVTTNPSGADIYINDKYIGVSPIERTKISSGTYKFTVYKSKHNKEKVEVKIESYSDIDIPIKLEPAFGKLIIKSTPTNDATIYVNDKIVGETPYSKGKFPCGEYLVSLEKNKWLGQERTIVIKRGKVTEEIFNLERNFGRITINSPNSKIYIDDKYVGKNYVVKDVNVGDYLVKATRKNHYDKIEEVSVDTGEIKKIKLNPEPTLTSIYIGSEPFETKGSEIMLDGILLEDKTPCIIETIIGKHKISVNCPKYISKTKELYLKKGKNEELVFNLVPIKNSSYEKMKKWKTRKWLYFTATVISTGAGGVCHYFYEDNHKKFDNATTSSSRASYLESLQKWRDYRNKSLYISVAPAVMFFYSWIKEAHYAKKARIEKGEINE